MDRLSQFEITRIIGTRATQLAEGAKPTIDTKGIVDCLEIAEKEFKLGKIPIIVQRTFPNGEVYSLKFKNYKVNG